MELAETEENLHHAWVVQILKVLCEFRTRFAQPEGVVRIWHKPGAVVLQRLYLPHFSSKSYSLKHWILDFLSFEMVYIMYKMDFGKCCKSAKEDCSCCPLFSSFSLSFSLLLFASLLCLACLNDPKSCQNTKTSHKYD